MELPSWSDSAWTRTQREPTLVAALDAYLEGLQAATRHPSLAAVSFVASAESLASKLFKLKRCESCSNRLGLGRAFKMTLRKVLTEEEALALDSVYLLLPNSPEPGDTHSCNPQVSND